MLASRKTMNESCKLRDEIKLLIKTFGGMNKLEELLQAASTKQATVQNIFYIFSTGFYFIVVNSYPGINVVHARLQFFIYSHFLLLLEIAIRILK